MARREILYLVSIGVIAVLLALVAVRFLPGLATLSTGAAAVLFVLLLPGAVALLIAAGFGFGPRTAPGAFHLAVRVTAVWTLFFTLVLWTIV